jgi:hypothetical protein
VASPNGLPAALPRTRGIACFAAATSRRAQAASPPVRFWAVLGALLAVQVLLGIILMRSRDQPVQIASTPRVAQRESPVYAPASAPHSSAHRLAGTITMMPTNEAASDARPTKNSVGTPRTIASSRRTGSAKATIPQFIGVLGVASVPTGAAVFIDQQDIGKTPLQLKRLRAGSHAIRIEHEGYERWTTAVLVPADKQTRVSAKLRPVRDR